MKKSSNKDDENIEKIIYNTTTGTTITPYKKNQSKYLESGTSLYDPATHRRIEYTGYRLPGMFVTHHQPPFVISNSFSNYQIKNIPASKYKSFDKEFKLMMNDDFELRDNQFKMIQQIMNDTANKRWFINVPQGFGKTIIGIYLVTRWRVNTIIMCYSTEILDQWKETIENLTNAETGMAIVINSSKILEAIDLDEFDISKTYLYLATPGIITKYASTYGYDKINKLFNKMGIGLKIFDEAHRNLGNMIKIDALSSIDKTIYLSGDFAQSNKVKTILFQKMFADVKLVIPSKEESDNMKYTRAVIIEYTSKPEVYEEANVFTKRGFSSYKYMKYQLEKGVIVRALKWLLDSILKLKETDRRILIILNLIEQTDTIYEMVKEWYPTESIGRFHGECPDEEKTETKDNSKIIVASYQSFGTGLDTSNIKHVITMSITNRVEDSQISGRARPLPNNEKCMYYMLIDTGFAYAAKKEKERIDYLSEKKLTDITRIHYVD